MTRALHALVDGLPVENVSIDDRGVQYGHGMFETCHVANGRIPLWQLHHARLSATAARPRIPLAYGRWRASWAATASGRDSVESRSIVNALEARFGFPRSR
jgi:branched-subunit amino acid aminotransferase/4-amino-4-deoxychorismate lyase